MRHETTQPRPLKSALLAAAAIGAISLVGAGVAQADALEIGYSTDGGSTINTVASQTASPTTGLLSYAGYLDSTGVYSNPISVTGTGSLTAFPEPKLSSTTLDLTKNMGSNSLNIRIYATEYGLSAASPHFQTTFTTNTIDNATVTMYSYVDYGNSPYGTGKNTATSDTFTAAQKASPTYTSAIANAGQQYSETLIYDISFGAGSGDVNLSIKTKNANSATLPEPGSLALLGTGLLGLGLVARRRRRTA